MSKIQQILSTAILLFCSIAVFSQSSPKGFEWIRHHGDNISSNPEWVRDIQTDRFGNIYVAGEVNAIFVRDSTGTPIKSIQYFPFDSLANYGGVDVWLAKYSPQGDLLWHRYAGSGADDEYYDMVADENGNCYISGRLKDHNTRKPFSFNRTPKAIDELGVYIAKVSSSGDLLWHKSFGGDTLSGGGSYIEYSVGPYNLSLNSNEISCFFAGGGEQGFKYQLFFDQDSLDQSIHEAFFDLNGNYKRVKTLPFPKYDRLPKIETITKNTTRILISGSLTQDTTLVGNDTIYKSGLNNAFVFSFDTSMQHLSSFYGTNQYEQFRSASLFGDTLVASGHYDLFNSSTVTFDTIVHQGSPNAFQESGIFLFNTNGSLLGLYPSKSIGNHTATVGASFIDRNTIGIGGSFNQRMTFSGTSNYIEAVDRCASCTNIDLFFSLLDRNGNLLAEDVIYTSGFQTDAVFAMHVKDSILYIGGFVGDSVIIEGVDTFVTRGANDAFLAAYNLGFVTSLEEPSTYIKADNGLLAYPNPTRDRVTLMGNPVNSEAQLYTISGQLVKTYRLNEQLFQQSINLQNLESGVYFLIVIGEEGKQELKIVKE